ncbi:MAG: peptidylprolyl isomerase [Desulfobacterales bacterium]|nr:peptidylprolyl isomerase [Desulfobacterales bacterium]
MSCKNSADVPDLVKTDRQPVVENSHIQKTDSAENKPSTGSTDTPALAYVGERPVTEALFDAYLKFRRVPAQDEKRRKALLEQYIEREALASAIESENLLDKDLMQAELNEFRKEMLISRYFEKYLAEKVTDSAVQNYYSTHAEEYEELRAHAAHILIRTNRKMSEPERKAKLTTAHEALSRTRSGKDFAEVAKDYSEDRNSAKKGGDLGWIRQGSIDPKFSEILFSSEPGAVSDPFETQFGFHIIKLLEPVKTVKQPFESVAGDIRYQLRNRAKRAELERLVSGIKVEIAGTEQGGK